MAQIIKKQNELGNKYALARGLFLLGLVIFFVGVVFAVLSFGSGRMVIGFVVGYAGLFFGIYMNKQARIYKAGISGESSTAELVRQLPEDYFGVQNLKVTYDKKTSEIDLVVVGPAGVFIVETKNQKGEVTGDAEGQNWVLLKIGRKGSPYTKTFYNPVKQVGTHTYRLANFLRQGGVQVRVESAVYFSNPETTVLLTGTPKNARVFCAQTGGGEDLKVFLTGGGQRLSQQQIQRVRQLLGC